LENKPTLKFQTETAAWFYLIMIMLQALANVVPALLTVLLLAWFKVPNTPLIGLAIWIIYSVGMLSMLAFPVQMIVTFEPPEQPA